VSVAKSQVDLVTKMSDESLAAFTDRLLAMLRAPQLPAVQRRAEVLYDAARAEARRRAVK
jgi:hypothetical protein